MDIFSFLINLIIFAILASLIWWVLGLVAAAVGVPGNILQLLRALFVVLFVVWLLGGFFGRLPLVYAPAVAFPAQR